MISVWSARATRSSLPTRSLRCCLCWPRAPIELSHGSSCWTMCGATVTTAMRAHSTFTYVDCAKSSANAAIALKRLSALATVLLAALRPRSSSGHVGTGSSSDRVSLRLQQLSSCTVPGRYRDCVKTKRADFRLKGCQIVAGGRSVAQTTGKEGPPGYVPRRGATVFLPPVPGVELFSIVVRWSALRCDHRLLSDSPSG